MGAFQKLHASRVSTEQLRCMEERYYFDGTNLQIYVKTNDLAFFEAKNELVFECKRTQIEAKK